MFGKRNLNNKLKTKRIQFYIKSKENKQHSLLKYSVTYYRLI